MSPTESKWHLAHAHRETLFLALYQVLCDSQSTNTDIKNDPCILGLSTSQAFFLTFCCITACPECWTFCSVPVCCQWLGVLLLSPFLIHYSFFYSPNTWNRELSHLLRNLLGNLDGVVLVVIMWFWWGKGLWADVEEVTITVVLRTNMSNLML